MTKMTKETAEYLGLYNIDAWLDVDGDYVHMPVEVLLGTSEGSGTGLTVISTSEFMFGASVLCHPEVIEEVANEMETDLIILPSSIHEILVIPDSGHTWEELSEMIREINFGQVAPEIWLGNTPLFYKRGSFKVTKF